MEDKLQNILNGLYEAEGLIELALRRNADARIQIVNLAVQKCFDIADRAASLKNESVDDEESNQPTLHDTAENIKEEKDPAEKIFINEVLPAAPISDDKTITAEEDADLIQDAKNEPATAPEAEQKYESESESIPADEDIPLSESAQESTVESVAAPSNEGPLAFPIEDSSIFDTEDDEKIDSEAEVEAEEEEDEAIAEADEEDKERTVVTPELGIVRKPLAKYMTINDKFRFRRELFSNNTYEFNDALSLIETMENMDEVADYFFNDLEWDPELAEVKEFLTLVERYFKASN